MDKPTRILRDMKYSRIIELIAKKCHIPLEEAMNLLYSSPLFDIIDDGTADLSNLASHLSELSENAILF